MLLRFPSDPWPTPLGFESLIQPKTYRVERPVPNTLRVSLGDAIGKLDPQCALQCLRSDRVTYVDINELTGREVVQP